MLGDGVDPRMFVQDFSGFTRAGEMQAQSMSNLGQQIGGVIKQFGEENKQIKSDIAKGKSALAFAKAYHPELSGQIEELSSIFQDPSKSPLEQAAAGAQMGEFVAAMLGGERFNKEMALRRDDMALRRDGLELDRMNAASVINARDMETNMALESSRAMDDIGSFSMDAAIKLAKGSPAMEKATGISAEDLEAAAKNLSPKAQAAIAKDYFGGLPREVQREYKVMPVQVGGKNADLPVWLDPLTGQATPVDIDLPMVLPPKMLQTEEGAEIPSEEASVVGTGIVGGNAVTRYEYNGEQYHVIGGPSIVPGNIKGQDISVRDQIAVEKFNEEKVAKQQASEAAVAKSERMATLLDELDKHPGFSGLFGFGMGARKMPGTDAAGAETLFKQIDAMGFIEAIKDMKGMGALSNAEGEKVSAALVGMDPKMPEKEARAKIKEVKAYIALGLARAKSGTLVNPDGTPQAVNAAAALQPDPVIEASQRLRGLLPTQ